MAEREPEGPREPGCEEAELLPWSSWRGPWPFCEAGPAVGPEQLQRLSRCFGQPGSLCCVRSARLDGWFPGGWEPLLPLRLLPFFKLTDVWGGVCGGCRGVSGGVCVGGCLWGGGWGGGAVGVFSPELCFHLELLASVWVSEEGSFLGLAGDPS